MGSFKVGQSCVVNDKASFYFGQTAVVVEVVMIESLSICRVAVGNVTFAVRSEKLAA